MASEVKIELLKAVAVVTLNRPHSRNALTPSLLKELFALLKRVEEDEQIRVIVLTGAGEGFCAGADLRAGTMSGGSESEVSNVFQGLMTFYHPVIELIVNMKKIVIAAINGVAAGAGASLALACDFRVMAENASILQAFINIGLVPDAGSTYFLARAVGYSKALEIAVEGKRIPAETCKQLNLTNKVVPSDKLLSATLQWAEELAAKPFSALLTKNLVRAATTLSLPETMKTEALIQNYLIGSEDNVEGVTAFLSKRKANFSGKGPNIPNGIISKL